MKFKTTLFLAALLGASSGSALGQSSLLTNLVAYWPLDTTDGICTPDLAFGNSLFLINSPAQAAGQRNLSDSSLAHSARSI
jgi:hypothetical protein